MKKGKEDKKVTPQNKAPQVSKEEKEIQDKRREQANRFEEYMQQSGLSTAFQLIFSELIAKQVNPENYFSYVAIRLRDIGKELNDLKQQSEPADHKDEEHN